MKTLIILLLSALTSLGAVTNYVSVTGGTGAGTLSDPWSPAYAHSQVQASNTLVFMDGIYSNEFDVPQSYVTVTAQHKWLAVMANSPALGLATFPATVHDVTIDGFQVAYSGTVGIQLFGSNCVVRNCWVHHSGQSHGVNVGSGISSDRHPNTLVEQNLLQDNGWSAGFDHGIYLSGTNCIVRNNVCRRNLGFGIQIYSGSGCSDQCQIYGNLCYGNYGNSTPTDIQLVLYTDCIKTNYVFSNILIATNSYAIEVKSGTVYCMSNILVSAGGGIHDAGSTVIIGGYNLAPQVLSMPGGGDAYTPTVNTLNILNQPGYPSF